MDKQLSRKEVLELAKQLWLSPFSATLMEQGGTSVGVNLNELTQIVNAALLSTHSQQVEAARNAALEWVNGTPYAVDKVWAIDERDLMHLLSVKIGAAYVDPVAAAERARVHIAPLPSSPAEQKEGNV